MNNISDILENQSHETATVICAHCGYAWTAVWPVGCEELTCPDCNKASRIPIENPLHLLRVDRRVI